METVVLEGVEIRLTHPDELPLDWVGGEDLLEQLLAAWSVLDERDLPMNPRLIGRPGVGKTTLAYAAAKRIGKPVYFFQATMDTRPEDLIVTPVVGPDQKIVYVAGPVVSAMIKGGVCILDEGNRMSEKSWAGLAPLLDTRRYVESIVAGVKIRAHPEFRFVATMNQDTSTFDLPEYVQSRLQPQIEVPFPSREEEARILKYNVPFAPERMLQYATDFLARAHDAEEPFTVRDGISLLRYTLKLAGARSPKPVDPPRGKKAAKKPKATQGEPSDELLKTCLEQSVRQIVGPAAIRHLSDAPAPKSADDSPDGISLDGLSMDERFDVVLQSAGEKRFEVIQALRSLVPGLSLRDAKELADSPDRAVLQGVDALSAVSALTALRGAGAEASIRTAESDSGGLPSERLGNK